MASLLLSHRYMSHPAKSYTSPDHTPDLIGRYLHTLADTPRLSAAQEIELAQDLQRHEKHTWLQVLGHPRLLTFLLCAGQGELSEALEKSLHQWRASLEKQALRHARQARLGLPAPGESWPQLRPQMHKRLLALVIEVRAADADRKIFDAVMLRAQAEICRRRPMGGLTQLRLGRSDLKNLQASQALAQEARDRFIAANLRLVVRIARDAHSRSMPLVDAIQEGNLGLVRAIHRFDPARGFRFSTYAHWWIKQAIERAAINKASGVRIPVHVREVQRKVRRGFATLQQTLHRVPHRAEVAVHLGMPESQVRHIQGDLLERPVSWEAPLREDSGCTMADVCSPNIEPNLEEQTVNACLHAQISNLLNHLRPMERDILNCRFGLNNQDGQTLAAIAERHGLSLERVRRIQNQSLRKMRKLCELHQMHAF